MEIVSDREAWWAAAHGVAKSWTQLSDWTSWKKLVGGRQHTKMNSFLELISLTMWEDKKSTTKHCFCTVTIKKNEREENYIYSCIRIKETFKKEI